MWCELLKGAKQWLSLTYKLTAWKLNISGHMHGLTGPAGYGLIQ